MENEHDERIPTIFPQPEKSKSKKSYRSKKPKLKNVPYKTLIKAVTDRIQNQRGLHEALSFIRPVVANHKSECMEKLVAVVAQTLIDVNELSAARLQRDRAKDSSKKTKRRWKYKTLCENKRAEQLKKFTRVAHRKQTTQYDVNRIAEKPARYDRKPYRRYRRALFDLLAKRATQPNKIIAAITGLFNLHPRTFCKGCRHFPKQRKSAYRRKNKSLTSGVRRGVDMCKLENIFECPKRHISAVK